jgi:hypothetical protein
VCRLGNVCLFSTGRPNLGPDDAGFPNSTQQNVGIQELSTYLEVALLPRLSIFGDIPVRRVIPLDLSDGKADNGTGQAIFTGQTQTGAGDITGGFRVGLIDHNDEWLTFQFTAYLPTGSARQAVSWTVINGFETAALRQTLDGTNVIRNATGDTIVNGKYGLRFTNGGDTVYAGFGNNWTEARWYSTVFRVEFTHAF